MYPQITFPAESMRKNAVFSSKVNPNKLTSNSPKDSNQSSLSSNAFISRILLVALLILASLLVSIKAQAQVTYGQLKVLKVHPHVTTFITAHEPIEVVDISTDNVIGEKTLENTLSIKPVNDDFYDGAFLATLTIITERYRVQYVLVYTEDYTQAVTDKELMPREMTSFKNPEIMMSKEDMRYYASRIFGSGSHIRNVSSKKHKMKIRLNNIYSIGDYFFLDISIENHSNIPFDIDEIRLKLSDKKIAKATNNQMIELYPEMILKQVKKMKKSYRNIIVVPKMTFPNEKVLTLEISEKQISGRTLKLNIDYEDILNADSFSDDLMPRR